MGSLQERRSDLRLLRVYGSKGHKRDQESKSAQETLGTTLSGLKDKEDAGHADVTSPVCCKVVGAWDLEAVSLPGESSW